MNALRRNPVVLNLLVIAVTIVFVALALTLGRPGPEPAIQLAEGQPSPQQFLATGPVEVVDEAATEQAREQARRNVDTVRQTDVEAEQVVARDITALFIQVAGAAAPVQEGEVIPGDPTASTIPESTTSTTTTTTTTVPPSTLAEGEPVPAETSSTTSSTTTLPPPAPPELQVARLAELYQFRLEPSTLETLVALQVRDAEAVEAGEERVLDDIEGATLEEANDLLDEGILPGDLGTVQSEVRANPPFLSVAGLDDEQREAARVAVADILASFLQSNLSVDLEATDNARAAAAAAVPDVTVTYISGQEIVGVGQPVDQVHLDAIEKLGLLAPEPGDTLFPIVALGAIAVLLTAFFLWRIAPVQWSQPKHFALLGVLLIMAAVAARIPEAVITDSVAPGYVLPAVMFGYLAAILYDPRTAVLLSVPMAAFTAISTNDLGLTVYAGTATVAPVAFVSSVSSRRELRVAVALSAAVLAPLAGAVAWMFTGPDVAREAAIFGVVGGIVAGLAAQGLLSFLENLFRVTTTITLLDLTDRNHPALRLIEEKAPGTFNHSILVGTLAGKAARAIGADPLLAQAAAFYHDLGKTARPQYFIENQFGVSNPHDELPPEESAVLIGDHVTEGLKLARQFKLPSEISDGIRMHHGTGLMRYFYHKALEEDPGVDPSLYRHQGRKPRRKEMAILMICDACEGAARAMAQQEDPTGDSLRKLVDSIVNEKLEDGQLDESALTFGDLTRVKHAIVEALIGYYHTRIPYPGFPGPRVESS